MAKKSGSAAAPAESDYVGRIAKQLEDQYGNILGDARNLVDHPKQIIPVSPSIDLITSGGFIEGSCIGITGPPKHCKTSLALTFAANAQKPEYGSRPIYYAKIEGRLSRALIVGTRGLKLENPYFNLIKSTKEKILTAQEWLTILVSIIRDVPKAVIIIDSISALCDEREMNEGMGTETRGGGAKLFSQFCRLINNVVPVNDTIVIGITHLIANTSGMGAALMERCAKMWEYQRDYALRVKQRQDWKVGERSIGYQLNWTCNVSPLGPPGMSIDSYLRFGVGLDGLFEVINLGIASGLVKKSGAWLTIEPPSGEIKTQGGEKLYRALEQNEAAREWLTKQVLSMNLPSEEENEGDNQ